MNIHFFIQSVTVLILATAAFAADILTYPEALEKAKEEKKDIIVLSDGSNWLPESPVIQKAYRQFVDNSDLKDKVIWAINDEKTGLPEEERQALRKLPGVPLKIWSYPGLQVVDCQGRGVFMMQKLTGPQILQAGPILEKVLKMREKRDKFWEQADKTKGPRAAEYLAKGLALLPSYTLGYGSAYRKELDRLKKEDPEDKKGYHLRFTFSGSGFIGRELNPLLKEKKFKEAYRLTDKYLKLPALTREQKQNLIAAKWRIARDEGQGEKAYEYLRQAGALDPQSKIGKACLRLYDYYTKPVFLPSLRWFNQDTRSDWRSTSVKVGNVVKAAGTYEIKFEHLGGKTRFRNPSFKSGKRTLTSVKNDKEGDSFELTLTGSAPSDMILEFEARGGGAGDIVITKKS